MKPKDIATIVLFGFVVLAIFGLTVFAVKAYHAPLGPVLQVVTPTSIVMPTESHPVDQSVCGETAAWNILVLGSDVGEPRGAKGSDLTRMLHVDFLNRRVTMYTFPRQLWVDTAGLGLTNPAIDATQLGTVFYEARSRSTSANMKQSMVQATTITAQMLSKNFLVSTDHYLTIDLNQVPAMVDAIGGVPINVPQQITDQWIGTVIPAGQQTLNGMQFVAYARAIPDSDFGRIQRNNLLISALREKLLDPGVWGQIPQLYGQFNESVVTDLSPEQINHLACLLKEVPSGSIAQDQVKPEWTWAGPQVGSLLWDKTSVINQLMGLGLIR